MHKCHIEASKMMRARLAELSTQLGYILSQVYSKSKEMQLHVLCVLSVPKFTGVEVGEKWWGLGVKGTANGKVG